ncbi:hypothetical protein CDAR_53081 [Caerostris darwini]|uniref:Uncharacterized protein n=1 Tax=Caerostris darwini TaxID=1538125 RepID=A0AAV4QU59_9ARAC|nr:hypothetical protein CDAR_53081 [Caerostris darwini]
MDVWKVIGEWMWVTKAPAREWRNRGRGTEKGRGGRKAVLKSLSASNQGRLLGVNPSFATAGCRKLLIQVFAPCPNKTPRVSSESCHFKSRSFVYTSLQTLRNDPLLLLICK